MAEAKKMQVSEMLGKLDDEELNMAISFIQFLFYSKKGNGSGMHAAPQEAEMKKKKQAFAELEAFRKRARQYFPADFDYEKARAEAVEEKYGSFA